MLAQTPWQWSQSQVLNVIMQNYLASTTICLLWPKAFDLSLNMSQNEYNIVNIQTAANLRASFDQDIMDFSRNRQEMLANGLMVNDLIEKLTMSIDQSHCESFIALDGDILPFIEAFVFASRYSLWRSMRNKFVFLYEQGHENSFQHDFFKNQPSILLVEHEGSGIFNLKTNKFVGPKADHPETLYMLDRYDATRGIFEKGVPLFPDKTNNLQGRELSAAVIVYGASVIILHNTEKKNSLYLNYTEGKEEPDLIAIYADGTEAIVLIEFCEKYNCTPILDTTDSYDWGEVFPNGSSYGSIGMVAKGKAEISVGAMYAWLMVHTHLDLSTYFARTGVSLLVPAPKLLISWLLPLQPFQLAIWLLVVVIVGCEIISLLFVYFHEKRLLYEMQENAADTASWARSFGFAYSTALKLCVCQSGIETVWTTSLRLLLFACFMDEIVIISLYSGGLASILTVPTYEQVADSPERLEAFQLAWAGSSFAWVSTINGTDDAHMNAILNNFQVLSPDELHEKTRSAHMGFALERLPFGHYAFEDYITEHIIDRFKIMKGDIYFQYTVTVVERLWPLLPRYDNLLLMLHSSGIDKIWEWRVTKDHENSHVRKRIQASKTLEANIGPMKLQMANFIGMLLLWVCGIVMATLVFAIEMLYKRK